MMHKSSSITMMYASLPWRSSSMVTVTAVHDEFILPELSNYWQNEEQARGNQVQKWRGKGEK